MENEPGIQFVSVNKRTKFLLETAHMLGICGNNCYLLSIGGTSSQWKESSGLEKIC